ncbi:MAG TPA: hypothetical protein VKN99_01310 [Polyangia bacterium]|nr:hypothetical protein [Polyangia bacterium]
MRGRAAAWSVLLTVCAAACGTRAEPGNSPENPPFSGAIGYHKIDGTYVLLDPVADLTDPSVVADSPAGPFHIWFTYGGATIRRSDLPHLGTDATPPRPALSASEPWEAGRVAAPSVERAAQGFRMVYEAATDVIAVVVSSDGETWTGKREIARGHTPMLAGGHLFLQDSGFVYREGTPLFTGTDPDVIVRATPSDRLIWQMFYNCPGRNSIAICYAGSWDGASFVTTGVPILQPDQPDETGPSAVLSTDQAILFFAQKPTGLKSRIGAAVAP